MIDRGTKPVDDLGIVVIGRNEGDRLKRCLDSIGADASVVYVDSGSTDDSVASATAAGARVVALDLSVPFTAARARNAGRAALGPEVRLIQFVDGDCAVRPGWLDRARAALAGWLSPPPAAAGTAVAREPVAA